MEISNSKPPVRYSWDDESGEHHTMMLPNVVSVDMVREYLSGVVQWTIDIDCRIDMKEKERMEDLGLIDINAGTLEIGGDIKRSFGVYSRLLEYGFPDEGCIIIDATFRFSTAAGHFGY